MALTNTKIYTSPQRKPGKCFAHRRDRWKAPSRVAKTVLNRLGTRLGRGERRTAAYQEQLAALQAQGREGPAKPDQTGRELEELQKQDPGIRGGC